MARARADIRIATVYRPEHLDEIQATDMSEIRWLRVSEALARRGYRVDMIVNLPEGIVERAPGLRCVPYADAAWHEYDVIKTLFHKGFAALAQAGMAGHPFIISKLGSVVGKNDDVGGVHFRGDERAALYDIQCQIAARSRYVTVLTPASRELWKEEYGTSERCLLVPTGVDRDVPPPGSNPYAAFSEPVALYLGNIYGNAQRDINLAWQARLNALGRLLRARGIRLCFVGTGLVDQLDASCVTNLGSARNDRAWDYQYFARVGIALAQGPIQDNESSKIYYYLRTGLPVVAEASIPNCALIQAAECGIVTPYGDDERMAASIETSVNTTWDQEAAVRYTLENHTWDQRALAYDRVIRERLPS